MLSLLDLIFPKYCLGCKRSGKYICEKCIEKVETKPTYQQRNIYPLDGLVSLWSYSGVVRSVIIKLKYKFVTDVASEITKLAIRRLGNFEEILPKSAVIVPIPLQKLRKNWRGFNQAELIGKRLAYEKGWGYEPNLLVKTQKTKPQAELTRIERLTNLQGMFQINPFVKLNKSKPIILFDDVYTTGATLKEACGELKRGGYKKVWGLTLAR